MFASLRFIFSPALAKRAVKHAPLFMFAFAFAACSPSMRAELPRVLLLGDSISIGYAPELAQQLKGKATLCRLGNLNSAMVDLENPAGANGGNSTRVLELLRTAREQGGVKADWVLLNCGLHDIKTNPRSGARQVSLEQYENNLKACLDEAKRMNLRVAWVSTTPVVDDVHNARITSFVRHAADVDAYNAVARRVMESAGMMILDLGAFSKSLIPTGYKDHVHFSPEAASKQAAFLAAELTPLLAGAGTPAVGKQYDLVVYGGTPAGIVCAVRAAREGLSVLLISPWKRLGGQLSNGLSTMDALYNGVRAPLYDEVRQSIHDYYRKTYGADSDAYERSLPGRPKTKFEASVAEGLLVRLLQAEKRITVVKPWMPVSVTRNGRLISTATFREMDGKDTFEVSAPSFVDCSYEGDFLATAGVAYRVGRESRDEFKEEHAGKIFMKRLPWPPPGVDTAIIERSRRMNLAHYNRWYQVLPEHSTGEADRSVQAYNLRTVITRDPKNCIPITKPEGYDREELQLRLKTDVFWSQGVPTVIMPNQKSYLNLPQIIGLQHGYPDGDWDTRRKIIAEHARITLSLVYFMQNDSSVPEALRKKWRAWGLAKDEFADNNHMPDEIYARETRRMKGRATFTEHSARWADGLQRAPIVADSISVTDWFLDSHACTSEKIPGSAFEGQLALNILTAPGQISYDMILPKEVDNLLVPVCLSSTHVGWGALRLEPTWMSLAEATAEAVIIAKQTKVPPARIDKNILVRTLARRGVLVSFFNDIDVSPMESWMPAVQYFGTQGFFGTYDARPLDVLSSALGDAWAEATAQLLANRKEDVNERAAHVVVAENAGGAPLTVRDFLAKVQAACAKLGVKAPIDQALKTSRLARDVRMNRGDACRLMYALRYPDEKTAR